MTTSIAGDAILRCDGFAIGAFALDRQQIPSNYGHGSSGEIYIHKHIRSEKEAPFGKVNKIITQFDCDFMKIESSTSVIRKSKCNNDNDSNNNL
jgi:hypothetical protein